MKKLLIAILLLITGVHLGFGQCPTSGTISSDCTSGNLTVSGGTLTINSGVTVTITGTLNLNNGGTINAASDAIIDIATLTEGYGSTNTINGGILNISNSMTIGGGSNFTMDGVDLTVVGSISASGTTIQILNSTVQSSSFETNLNSFIVTNSTLTTTGTGELEIEDATITNSTFNIGGFLEVAGGSNTASNSTFNIGQGYVATTGFTGMTMNGGGSLTINNNSTMDIKGDVTNNEFYIDNSDVVISGDFDNAGAEILVVRNGGTIKVGGDYNNSGSGNTTAEDGGTIEIDGDYNNEGGGNTTVDGGGMVVGGDYTGNPPTVTGDADESCSGGSGGCCGAACDSLPVELISFNLAADESNISITWQTASEINNDYFNLYRSDDGLSFEIITTVDGHGTTNEVQNYSYTDYPAVAGTYYYKLQQVDYDGVNEFFDTKRIEIGKSTTELTVYPVPLAANQDFYVQYSETNETVDARIYDLSGNLQYQLSTERESNKIRFASSELGLSPGIYVVQIQLGQNITTQKIRLY
ncbi:T9SS type A sorting domain-containing protein [Gilvimarinus agarilyticus]|uniref:T9SS type A sorting domain-containing protein n=1 Tax=Reichenbachiella agariperforans TaxID=156994 RepID=UPI001C09D37E|nr:T9SS type A sorting domain-containing protein [Reichenbachiella agariperforans]MBU2884755.1 T9SS type A sorting domain-containing protein [Gilvimarinus agarilyticus]MBU2914923.1 T9SS type A sorting domain-containing protein [Reichenbachiella agariperforans]